MREAKPWWGQIETGFIFDNNIYQVKNNKESDTISESTLLFSYRPKEITWSAQAIFDRYLKNNALNYAYYEVGGQRPFGDRDYGSLFIHISPSALLDKEDPNRDPFSLSSYGVNASVDRTTDRMGNIGVNLSYTRLDYRAPFDAKDTHVFGLSPSLYYRINDHWQVFGEVTYEVAKARAGNIPTDIPDDISYRAQAVSLKVTRHVFKQTRIRFRYRLRKKTFTTNGLDTFHAGRKDNNHLLYVEVQYNPVEKFLISTRIERLWRNSNDTFVEFYENRLTVSVAYRF